MKINCQLQSKLKKTVCPDLKYEYCTFNCIIFYYLTQLTYINTFCRFENNYYWNNILL